MRIVRATVAASLFAIVNGGCGADVGGGGGIFDFPPNVQMERWESIAPGSCKGWLTNRGSKTARDVLVYFQYSTPQGDTVLAFAHSPIDPGAMVVIYAPAQITRGELRFPHLAYITFSGQGQFPSTGEGPPSVGYPAYPCLLSTDSAKVWVRNGGSSQTLLDPGLAYNVVLNVETTTGVAQIPLQQGPLGRLWSRGSPEIVGGAQGVDGWGNFHVQVRDSTGIKLLPALISIRWEDYAGWPTASSCPIPTMGMASKSTGFRSSAARKPPQLTE